MSARLLLLAMALSYACAGTSDAPAPSATVNAPAPPTSALAPGPRVPSPDVQVSAPACGYGGSAPAVSVFVDVHTAVALRDVSLSFTLSDLATGTARGVSGPPETIVVSPVERGLLDFSTQGTSPFDGTLAAGTTTRLEYFAGLHEGPAGEAVPGMGALRISVVVRTSAGVYTATCDTAEMWPSS